MKCTFFLKNSGILVKEKRVLSNYSTWFIKIIGFLGAVICLIAFFYIGPLAFSGAGMFAIFTIKLINYQSSERVKSIICFDEMIGFSIKGKNIITMVSNPFDTCENIYFSKEDKELVFSNLTKNYNFINFYEVNKINDVLSHPAKLESGKARRKIQEEMRSFRYGCLNHTLLYGSRLEDIYYLKLINRKISIFLVFLECNFNMVYLYRKRTIRVRACYLRIPS